MAADDVGDRGAQARGTAAATVVAAVSDTGPRNRGTDHTSSASTS
jgi:hypothetical protein